MQTCFNFFRKVSAQQTQVALNVSATIVLLLQVVAKIVSQVANVRITQELVKRA